MAAEAGTHETPPFGGFPPQLFAFLEGLERDNSKPYWEANPATWEEHVQQPVRQLMVDLEEEFGPLRTYRPTRDVRFSKDKSPYKTWVGVTTTERAVGGVGPDAELLRWKGAVVVKEYELADWMHQPQAIDRVREIWTATSSLRQWIDRYVGESSTPPGRRGN